MSNNNVQLGEVGDSIFLPSIHFGYVEYKITGIRNREKLYECRMVGGDTHGTITFASAKFWHVEDLPYPNRSQKNMHHF